MSEPEDTALARAASARQYLFEDDALPRRLEKTLALIARAMEFPTVRINILDADTQHTIGLVGAGPVPSIPRSVAFCDTVVETGGPVEVPDAVNDPYYSDFPDVVSGSIGAYLGVPLRGRENDVIGAVCVTDVQAREVEPHHVARLTDFAVVVERVLEVMRRMREQSRGPSSVTAGSRASRLGADALDRLAAAVRDDLIEPHYQPVVDLQSDRVRAYEVVSRWVPPGRPVDDARWLVPAARDTDVLVDLDLAVLRRAMVDLTRWHRTWPRLQLTVPLSARVLARPDCLSLFEEVVEAAGISPIYLNLLLTESYQWSPTATNAINAATDLRDLGFGILLQDYGTGWTALDQLLWLPVDGVKIDASLTAALGTPVGDALASGVIDLARAMELRTTVGGVRSARTAELARTMGADYAQGSFWARPVPASEIDRFVIERAIGDTGEPDARPLAAAALGSRGEG
ncbi:EAL domain-containing protein [Nakamurella flava]|uniref:EAL domain-containing protein n=1 Tax=Nakamurella flava TaxID=2576308 RepID=A0A4U6QJR0_9ACTN|nr:EAL domain-containing protein [Nakamurella flava]TKV60720.1 EAL domain-containing protein [Nakamurella flava]